MYTFTLAMTMNDQNQQYVGIVGDRLRAKNLSLRKDNFRDWVWIVGEVGAMSVDAYIPLPLNSGGVSPEQIAEHINRILQTDLSIMLLFRCHWHIVLCGTGWTVEQVANIQSNTSPRFHEDQVTVQLLEDI